MLDPTLTLYERLGGYDGIAAIVDDLLPRLLGDPQLGQLRDRTSLLVIDTQDQEFVGMPLIVNPERRHAQLRTTAPERSRETGPSRSLSAKRSMPSRSLRRASPRRLDCVR